jgi:hypothetical protein
MAFRAFIPDPDGIRELVDECDYSEIAGEVAEEAKAIAPVSAIRDKAHYRDTIRAEGDYVVAGNDTVYYAWILEFGSVDTPVFATLTTAAIHRGLEVSQIEAGSGSPTD